MQVIVRRLEVRWMDDCLSNCPVIQHNCVTWPYREVFHDCPQPLKAGITASTGSEFLGMWLFCHGYSHPAACYGTCERSTECAVPLWRPRGSRLCCGLPSGAHALCMGQGHLSLRGVTGAQGGGGGKDSVKAIRLIVVVEGGRRPSLCMFWV